MAQFEYMALVLSIEKQGFLSRRIAPDCVSNIERRLNRLGQRGWELVSVFPFTNGGSPAAIEQAIHYFRRQRNADTDDSSDCDDASEPELPEFMRQPH